MAQDFENSIARDTGTSGATIRTANSDDAIVGLRLANITSGAITVDAFITRSSANYYLVKGATIPAGSSLELIHLPLYEPHLNLVKQWDRTSLGDELTQGD